MARAKLCLVLCAVWFILASVLLRVPPLKFPSLPISLPPTLLSLAPLLHPSSARFLPPLFPRSVNAYVPSSLVPFLNPRSHPPSHPPSFLAPSLRPSLPSCLPLAVQCNVHSMCVWQGALYCVAPSDAWHCSRQWGVHARRRCRFNGPLLRSANVPPPRIKKMSKNLTIDTCKEYETNTVDAHTSPQVSAATHRAFYF